MLDITDRVMLEEELRKHRDGLELIVSERTEELRRINEMLRHEIEIRMKSESALRSSEERTKNLSRKIVESQDEERSRLSRELHDEVGQQIAAVLFYLTVLKQNETVSPESLTAIEGMVKGLGESIHVICRGLQPMTIGKFGLIPAIKMMIWEFCEIFDKDIVLDVEKAAGEPDDVVSGVVYRIIQEALTNALRHSEATEISVALYVDPFITRLTVKDNGVGFDIDSPGSGNRLGLNGMKQRAKQVGGTLGIDTRPGNGVTITFTVGNAEYVEG